jgi:hypothetical protein
VSCTVTQRGGEDVADRIGGVELDRLAVDADLQRLQRAAGGEVARIARHEADVVRARRRARSQRRAGRTASGA